METSTGTMVTSTMDWEMGSRSVAEMVKEGGGVLFSSLIISVTGAATWSVANPGVLDV